MGDLYKRFRCWLGWHSPWREWVFVRDDGCSVHARCPWCGYEGMIDSQGDLF